MPVYDCGAPDCEECQRAFGPDRSKAIANYKTREVEYAEIDRKSRAHDANALNRAICGETKT